MCLITLFNSIFNISAFYDKWWIVAVVVVVAVIIEILIDLILAGIVHIIKDKHFREENKLFVVSKKERQFYEKIGIKKWKDKVLELGAIGGFSKSKLTDANNLAYIDRFLIESYKGIVTHITNIVFGFLIMLIPPIKWSLCVGLPVALVNFFLGMLPIFILRYNIPKLQVAKKRLLRSN